MVEAGCYEKSTGDEQVYPCRRPLAAVRCCLFDGRQSAERGGYVVAGHCRNNCWLAAAAADAATAAAVATAAAAIVMQIYFRMRPAKSHVCKHPTSVPRFSNIAWQ